MAHYPANHDGTVQRAEEEEPVKAAAPEVEITEEHVTNVAQQLYLAGASAFFHIDAADAAGEATAPPVAAAEPGESPAAACETPAAGDTPEPFAVRYQRFSRGELSNADVLIMLEEAVHDGHLDELHELLYFGPETGQEHIARYYYQAEYHLLSNRPLQALEILAKLDTPDLPEEDKLRVWYKIAVAQRMTHNYAGAATTLGRLVERFPGRDDLARLKRRNHEQYIENEALAATPLEKTSSLD